MSASADRNLLFGILALQMDFITRDQLVAGMNVCLLDEGKSLGEILLAQGSLSRDLCDLLEVMVEKHVEVHDHDAGQSLAALSSVDSGRKFLEQINGDAQASPARFDDRLLQGVVRDEAIGDSAGPDGTGSSSPQRDRPNQEASTQSFAVGEASTVGQRFRILRPHAEGGLGRVSVALDSELNREVALKEIKDRHAENVHARARFLLEAEITGCLEHPGIVPVYGLGHYPNGRPFYAMRFIRGDSLKDAIARFHKQSTVENEERRQHDSPRLSAAAANDFCSLEFRQLLGRFIHVCNAIAYAHSRGVLHRDLKPGNIMVGKYGETLVVDWGLAKAGVKSRAPEPSNQESRRPEEPTLKPSPGSSDQTLPGSALGTPAFMSPEQAEGRLDELGPASDVYSLGATLYQMLTGCVPFDETNVADILHKVRNGTLVAPRRVNAAIPAALEAVCLKAMALRPSDRYATPRALADDIEHWLADEPVGAWPEPGIVRARRWARRHKPVVSAAAATLLLTAVTLTVAAFWQQHRNAETRRKQLIAEEGIKVALAQAQQARDDLHRSLKQPGGVFALLNHPSRWQAQVQVGQSWLVQGKALLAALENNVDPGLTKTLGDLEKALAQDEMDRRLALRLETTRMNKVTLVNGLFDHTTALRDYPAIFSDAGLDPSNPNKSDLKAIASSPIKEQLVASLDDWAWTAFSDHRHSELPTRLMDLARKLAPDPEWGDRLRDLKLWRDANAVNSVAKEANLAHLSPHMSFLTAKLLKHNKLDPVPWLREVQSQHPADFWLNFELGVALNRKTEPENVGFFRAALAIRPDSVATHVNIANALRELSRFEEAETACNTALQLDPTSARAYATLGDIFVSQNRYNDAIWAYQSAIKTDHKLSYPHAGLGVVLYKQGRFNDAIDCCRKAIDLNPKDAAAYSNLGQNFLDQNRMDEAFAALQKAIELRDDLAVAHNNLGVLFNRRGDLDGAIASYKKAVDRDPKYIDAHYNLGAAFVDQGRLQEAEDSFRKAICIDPTFARGYFGLGSSLRRQKLFAQGNAAWQRAIDLLPADDPLRSQLQKFVTAESPRVLPQTAHKSEIVPQMTKKQMTKKPGAVRPTPANFPATPIGPAPEVAMAAANMRNNSVEIELAVPRLVPITETRWIERNGKKESVVHTVVATEMTKSTFTTDRNRIVAFRNNGSKVSPAELPKLLAKQTAVALFRSRGSEPPVIPDGYYVQVLRDDVLILVVPEDKSGP